MNMSLRELAHQSTHSLVKPSFSSYFYIPNMHSALRLLANENPDDSPVGVVITTNRNTIALAQVPLSPHAPSVRSTVIEQNDSPFSHTQVYTVFDMHSRESRPNGPTLVLFHTPREAAQYLDEILEVGEAPDKSGDLGSNSFSAYIFTPHSRESGGSEQAMLLEAWKKVWEMLYETTVELAWAREVAARVATVEQEAANARRERDDAVATIKQLQRELHNERAQKAGEDPIQGPPGNNNPDREAAETGSGVRDDSVTMQSARGRDNLIQHDAGSASTSDHQGRVGSASRTVQLQITAKQYARFFGAGSTRNGMCLFDFA
ncbi:hypothetical protein DL93DRAFT_1179736 [Clavulina sp. PMI_390]|nr:hypothetical protein DL93DRAFT_1179736 [Clavulina sp. PMI_390]